MNENNRLDDLMMNRYIYTFSVQPKHLPVLIFYVRFLCYYYCSCKWFTFRSVPGTEAFPLLRC